MWYVGFFFFFFSLLLLLLLLLLQEGQKTWTCDLLQIGDQIYQHLSIWRCFVVLLWWMQRVSTPNSKVASLPRTRNIWLSQKRTWTSESNQTSNYYLYTIYTIWAWPNLTFPTKAKRWFISLHFPTIQVQFDWTRVPIGVVSPTSAGRWQKTSPPSRQSHSGRAWRL